VKGDVIVKISYFLSI